MKTLLLTTLAVSLLSSCGQPLHLQYDYGRAYTDAMLTQADLTRPSAVDSAYPLTGFEGLELRLRVTEESTDAESGNAEATQTVETQ